MNTFSADDKREFQGKDQRISFLAIFRDLCAYYKDDKLTVLEIAERAKVVVEWEFKQWPLVEIKDEPFPSKMPPRQPVGQWKDPVNKPCPVCGKFMVAQIDKTNEKAPDWKCSDKDCKFQWDKNLKTFVPSKYITGVWN